MKIGKKSLNSIALEKQKQNLGTPTIPVSRNATVFQFPDLSTSSNTNTTNIKSEPSVEATKVVQALTFSDEKPNNNTSEHLYATVNKPKNGQNGQNGQKSSLTTAESNSLKHTLPQHPYESHKNLSLQNFPPPPQQLPVASFKFKPISPLRQFQSLPAWTPAPPPALSLWC